MKQPPTSKDIIFNNTVIIPELVAENAARETIDNSPTCKVMSEEAKYNLVQEYVPKLVEKADTVYMQNEDFKKKINAAGNKGRDTLHMFMCHWTAALINNKPLNQ